MQTTSIQGRNFCYRDCGKGFPVLFGHSYLWDSAMWAEQVAVLSQHFRCIVPDLWAHGESDTPPTDQISINHFAAHHWELLQTLGINKFAVVGLSVGGMWATQLTLNHPESVQGLVLMDTFVGDEPQTTQQSYFGMLDSIAQLGHIPEPMINTILPLFFSDQAIVNGADYVLTFRKYLQSLSGERLHAILGIGRAIFSRKSLLEKLPSINIPTLIMTGEHDRPRPVSEARVMAEHMRKVSLEVVESAGHISCVEQSEFVSRKLYNFLNNLYNV